jgi:hypothetical protein
MILEKNERFQNEYRSFSDRISKVHNEKIKRELEDDLRSLTNEVRLLDQLHQDLLFQKNLSNSTADSKNKIIDLRKKISKKLDSWERSIK